MARVIGAIIAGMVTNKIGRKVDVAAHDRVLRIRSTQCPRSRHGTLFGARLGLGLAVGISLIAVPVFVAESVPARVRGATLVMYQVMGVCGIILGLLFTLLLADSTWSGGWRIMLVWLQSRRSSCFRSSRSCLRQRVGTS